MSKLTFEQLVAVLSDSRKNSIMRRIVEAAGIVQSPDYDREDDDITPHLFEEIGAIMWGAVYSFPEEPEPEPSQQPVLEPGQRAIYCRECAAPRAFNVKIDGSQECTVCGYRRFAVRVTKPVL